jgi:hypothetical protein
MDALIEISSSEFNEELFERIKSLVKSIGSGAITIRVNNPKSTLLRNETYEEYWDRVRAADEEIKQGKGVVFTMEELDKFIHEMPGK